MAVSIDATHLPRGNPGTADAAHRVRIDAATTAPWLNPVYT